MPGIMNTNNSPAPVKDSGAINILNDIYKYLDSQQSVYNKKISSINEDLSDVVDKSLREASSNRKNSDRNNKIVNKALRDIGKNQTNLSKDEKKYRKEELDKIDKLDKNTNKVLIEFKNGLLNSLSKLKDFIGENMSKSIKSFSDLAKVMRKANLSSAQKNQIQSMASGAISDVYKLFDGLQVSRDEINDFIEDLVASGKNLSDMSNEQRASYIALRKRGLSDEEAFNRAMSATSAQLKSTALALGDPAIAATLRKSMSNITTSMAVVAGGTDRALAQMTKNVKEIEKEAGNALSPEAASKLATVLFKVQTGLVEKMSDEEAALYAIIRGAKDAKTAVDVLKKSNLAQYERVGIIDDSFVSIQNFIKSGTNVGKEIRTDLQNIEANTQNTAEGKLAQTFDKLSSGIDNLTGGLLGKGANVLDEYFGDSTDINRVVSKGFSFVLLALGKINSSLTGSKLKDVISSIGKTAGSAGAAASTTAAVKLSLWAKIVSKIPILGKLPGAFAKVGGLLKNVLGPIVTIIVAVRASFKAGTWLAKTLFPGMYLALQKAGGILGSLKQIGSFIWDGVSGFFSGIWDNLKKWGANLYGSYLRPFFDNLSYIPGYLSETLTPVVTNIFDSVVWFAKDLLPNLFSQLLDLGSSLLDLGGTVITLIGDGFHTLGSYADLIFTSLKNLPTIISGKFQNLLFSQAASIVKSLGEMLKETTLFKSAGEGASAISAALTEMANSSNVEADLALAEIDSKLKAVEEDRKILNSDILNIANAAAEVSNVAGKIGYVDELYSDYHAKKELQRDKDRKELEAWEKKNSEKQNSVLEQIAENTKQDDSSIIKLANGGIINNTTQAIVGEAGKEAVLPLTKKDELSKVLNNLSSSEKLNLLKVLSKSNIITQDALLNAINEVLLGKSPSGISTQSSYLANKVIAGAAAQSGKKYSEMVCNQLVEAALNYAGFKPPTTGIVMKHFHHPKMRLVLNDPINGISPTDPALRPGMIMFSHPFTEEEAIKYNQGRLKPRVAGDPGHMGIYAGNGLWWNSTSSKNTIDYSSGKGIRVTDANKGFGVALTKPYRTGTYKLYAAGYYDGMFDNSITNNLPSISDNIANTAVKSDESFMGDSLKSTLSSITDKSFTEDVKSSIPDNVPSFSQYYTQNKLAEMAMGVLSTNISADSRQAINDYAKQAAMLLNESNSKEILSALMVIAKNTSAMASSVKKPITPVGRVPSASFM